MTGATPTSVVDGRVDPDRAVSRAAAELEAGGVVVLATDTVYGLAARVRDDAAVEAIFEMKRRPPERRVAVLVADADQAAELVDLTGVARALADEFWPGPLTIVAPRWPGTPDAVGDEGTIGVRCPDDQVVRAVAARVGPLAATSANRHGDDTPTSAAEVAHLFPNVGVVVDGGERAGSASTVVAVVDGDLTVLRPGPIGESRVREVVGSGFR